MPETRIPSENHIASTFGVSRGTAHRALRELTSEGYLVGFQGIGRFVAKTKQYAPLLEVKPISQEISERGETHSAKVLLLTQEPATPELALTFGLNVASPVYRSTIVHRANGRPVQLAERYVNPQFAPDYLKQDAGFIFVITNDGWWGDTPGHRQHQSYSRIRAIETRRSVARSANTGISSLINQKGQVLQHTNYWEPDVLRGQLNVNDKLTFYTRHGDYIARIAYFFSLLMVLYTITRVLISRKK